MPVPMSLDPSDRRPPSGPLAWTAATVLALGLVSLGLVHSLSRMIGKPEPARQALARSVAEPEVTGSIATVAAARSVALDPCSVRERLVVRGP